MGYLCVVGVCIRLAGVQRDVYKQDSWNAVQPDPYAMYDLKVGIKTGLSLKFQRSVNHASVWWLVLAKDEESPIGYISRRYWAGQSFKAAKILNRGLNELRMIANQFRNMLEPVVASCIRISCRGIDDCQNWFYRFLAYSV